MGSKDDDFWYERVELVDPNVLEQIASADSKAHVPRDDVHFPKRLVVRIAVRDLPQSTT